MNFHDDEMAAMMEREMQDEYMDRFAPMATMSDAHAEWHRNSGNPMGTPGCPMDACHPVDEDYDMSETHLWEYDNPVDMGMYDDDPNPYHGDDVDWGGFDF